MKTTYDLVLEKLEVDKNFRERRFKWHGIAELLKGKYQSINADMLVEAESMARYWRMILQDRPDLRGKDYDTGKKVSQEYQVNLGYEAGYHRDIKQTLF